MKEILMKKQLFTIATLALALTACENTSHKNANDATRHAQDHNKQTLNAGDQTDIESDRTITQKVRQNLMEDKTLSTNGKNVKIITINGIVTLRGPVNNENERNEIGKKAKAVNGVKNIDNQLEVIREVIIEVDKPKS
jgi:osmotically-inducible protein OsmY